ncbi:MAG: efflux RND transporter periplasmic adaptor subunit, partial [candidate division WOR-3 bacterium]
HPRLSIVIVLIIATIGISVWTTRAKHIKRPPTAYYEVKRANFVVSVVEGGSVEALREVSIRCEVEGTARIIYIVPEGTYVKKGDLLVELDSSQAQDQYNQQLISVQKAELAYVQALQQLEIQKSQAESDIRAAELALKFAQMDLEKFIKAEHDTTILQLSNNLANIEAQLAVSLNTYEWSKKLAEKGYETKRTVDSDELAVRRDRYQLMIISNQLWMTLNFDLPKQREQLASKVEEAKRELERVKQRAARMLAQYEADVLTQSNTLELQKRLLERYKRNLEACKIYAPQDGLVVYPVAEGRFSQESMIEEGAIVRNRQELIKLPDTSQMKVRVRIHESWIGLIKEGLPAVVVLDPMPDRTFKGVVSKVAPLPDSASRWMNPNLKVYPTEVLVLEPLPPTVKPGVSARVEIIVTNIPNALYIPIQAVTLHKGKPAVYVNRNGKDEPVHIEVGMFNTGFIQVVAGLQEGDRVLVAPPIDVESRDIEAGGILSAALESGAVPSFTEAREALTQRRQAFEVTNSNLNPDNTIRSLIERQEQPSQLRPTNRIQRIPEELLKRFDKDGDGQLSPDEKEAMRAEFEKARELFPLQRTNRPLSRSTID